MAVAAFKILDDLRQTLDDGIVLEGLEIAAAEAARIMVPVRIAAEAALNTAREELAAALEVEVTAKAAEETPVIDGQVGRGGQRPAKTNVRIWVLRVNDPVRYSSTSSRHATVLL